MAAVVRGVSGVVSGASRTGGGSGSALRRPAVPGGRADRPTAQGKARHGVPASMGCSSKIDAGVLAVAPAADGSGEVAWDVDRCNLPHGEALAAVRCDRGEALGGGVGVRPARPAGQRDGAQVAPGDTDDGAPLGHRRLIGTGLAAGESKPDRGSPSAPGQSRLEENAMPPGKPHPGAMG
jgi:hypothetical protein